ncbi:hypothetical protein Ddye_010969 [Dipteronia dyeriana]|uniref:DDE Tnp4 domain-containing protein n=1 Tax=Dipteronia dyeriana TaxID=168575 RepID=A0AAD9XER1_9ROSI|nr:hypothetical protein Ddye_010969 [Dipteronia dyeriana]
MACGREECFQNVLGLCNFNMTFKYVVIGWEGTTHDSRVLTETIRNPSHNFPIPPHDKYCLVDVAYTHTKGFMAPYCHVCYWLKDFRNGGRARGKEEVFNYCHSRLRNVIERAFWCFESSFSNIKTNGTIPICELTGQLDHRELGGELDPRMHLCSA